MKKEALDTTLLRKTKFSTNECLFPIPDKINWRLWIDDTFNPPLVSYNSGWIVAKTTKMIKVLIKKHGVPTHIHYGVIHQSKYSPNKIAKGILSWAIRTKQKIIGSVTFSVSASNSIVEAFRIHKHYKKFYNDAYDIEALKAEVKSLVKVSNDSPNSSIKRKKKKKKFKKF